MEAETETSSDAGRLEAAGLKLPVDSRIPLKDYYDLAAELLRKASVHRENRAVIELYIVLLRFSSLVLETIPLHLDYWAKHPTQRHDLKKKAHDAMSELESLKADVNFLADKLNGGMSPKCKEVEEIILIPTIEDHPSPKQALTTVDATEQAASYTRSEKLDADSMKQHLIIAKWTGSCRNPNQTQEGFCQLLPLSPSIDSNFKNLQLEKSYLYLEGMSMANCNTENIGILDSNGPPIEEEQENESHRKENFHVDQNYCAKLHHLTDDITSLTQEFFGLIYSSQQSDKVALEALREADKLKRLYNKEVRQQKKKEEILMDLLVELQNARIKQDEIQSEIQKSYDENFKLKTVIANLEDKHAASQYLVDLLSEERDDAKQEVKALRLRMGITGPEMTATMLHFTILELEQATFYFDNEFKIGEGRYTSVYKGYIRHTNVAIKIFDEPCFDGQPNFHQEIELLGRVRHPHFVRIIGSCPEASSLVYEYLHNGSLEDCITRKEDGSSLRWPARIRIATEVCSALIFLHSCNPVMIHGNLKSSNILLDANFTSKLCDLRSTRAIDFTADTSSDYPEVLAYIDPEFFDDNELTVSSDVYSFGVIILRLLTGLPASCVIKEVSNALNEGDLQQVMDGTMPEWPFIQASQLAHLGIRCCARHPSDRPTLEGEVWKVLESLMKASSFGSLLFPHSLQMDDVPSYFLCPILQDVMREPQVAADGFTYEAEAIQGWFEGGHDTSPMTNLKLPNKHLLPNRALRSVIQEWSQSRGRQL